MHQVPLSPSPVRGFRFLFMGIFCAFALLAGVLAGCRKDATQPASAGPVPPPEPQPLIFPSPADTESPSPAEAPDTLGWGKAQDAMSRTLDFDSAQTLFNRYKTAALALGYADRWYRDFCMSIRDLGPEAKLKLANAWVKEALESEDPRQRALISRYLPQFGGRFLSEPLPAAAQVTPRGFPERKRL